MEIDFTRPHSGRMLDYWLGGHHHFEIDRIMCQKIEESWPDIGQSAKQVRQLLGCVVKHMVADMGLDIFLDFGAGLPTCENTHMVAQRINPAVRVVYSDIDPIVVSYAQEILHDVPGVVYLEADATYPEIVLNSTETLQLIGDHRRVAIMYMNLSHVMTETAFKRSMQTLWDWCAPGSHLFMFAMSEKWLNDQVRKRAAAIGGKSGLTTYPRSLPELLALVKPWQVTEEGVFPQVKWPWYEHNVTLEGCYAMFLRK